MTAVVDQFGGIGWGFACRELGIAETGIDIEPTVELTRKSLGWGDHSICADILDLDPLDYAGIDGLISSPPCQSWSRAGKGAGLDDPRGQLVWQPLVWALAIRPRWVVCEQVPEARGAFELTAHRLREVGYHATTYTISAETLGVPQTRLRVFLVAHRDRPVDRPTLTHQRYRKGRPRVEPTDMLGHLPWVSMAEALGASFDDLEVDRRQTGVDARPCTAPAPTMTAMAAMAVGRTVWALRHIRGAGMVDRHGERPDRQLDEPSFGVTCDMWHRDYWWPAERPATTVCAVPVDQAGADKPVALTEQQGCTLMGFPAGTHEHLQGNKADRWRIIGNAVCPPVARAVLETVIA